MSRPGVVESETDHGLLVSITFLIRGARARRSCHVCRIFGFRSSCNELSAFRRGRDHLSDDFREGRPATADTETDIDN
ncbi:hypothetical protein EVAR_35454_1 [Eumeta japonica]|uniref:Uncharacterized protein n=1 Tax=Eumeta variegata TaxID=151549 RepID=A0A4C1XLX4_EUMVA|nr:hypothetical protein EVAR_35454_1 [Eumeta japonica]